MLALAEQSDIVRQRLPMVLAAAAQAVGNRDRFHVAGLLDADGVSLVADWWSAFQRLPPLATERVRAAPGQFLSSQGDVVYRGVTSGTTARTTGIPPFTYFAGAEWNQRRLAARQRSLAWWGIDERLPILNLLSRLYPLRPGDRSLVGPLDREWLTQWLALLDEGTWVLRGYPSRLCELAVVMEHIRAQQHPWGDLRVPIPAVICTGEPLHGVQRSLLSRTFQAPIINEYGCQETGISGLTCPEVGRLHLDGDRCVYEVLEGQLLTTDLWNTTMPLVRYACGDRLQLDDSPCPCGRPGPTARILGRTHDPGQPAQPWLELPPLPRLLNYQVQAQTRAPAPESTLTLWLQPEPGASVLDWSPVESWVAEQFSSGQQQSGGKAQMSLVLQLEPPPDLTALLPPRPHPTVPVVVPEDLAWAEAITQQSWSQGFPQPQGAIAAAGSALLQDLIRPRSWDPYGWTASREGPPNGELPGLKPKLKALLTLLATVYPVQSVRPSAHPLPSAIAILIARIVLLALQELCHDPVWVETCLAWVWTILTSSSEPIPSQSAIAILQKDPALSPRVSGLLWDFWAVGLALSRGQQSRCLAIDSTADSTANSTVNSTVNSTADLATNLTTKEWLTLLSTLLSPDTETGLPLGDWLGQSPRDRLTRHHLLRALELAGREAVNPRIKPLAAVFLGDLIGFNRELQHGPFGAALLLHWQDWLRTDTLAGSGTGETNHTAQIQPICHPIQQAVTTILNHHHTPLPPPGHPGDECRDNPRDETGNASLPHPLSPFAQAWLQWRQALLSPEPSSEVPNPSNARETTLAHLHSVAITPMEHQRYQIEASYAQLLNPLLGQPSAWDALSTFPGLTDLLQPPSSPPSSLPQINPSHLAWYPLLQHLAPRFQSEGYLDFAYRCWLLTPPINSLNAVFMAWSDRVNTKQTVA